MSGVDDLNDLAVEGTGSHIADDGARRDRWKRYLVVPPEGGAPVGYTRATTIAKTLDDTSNLTDWTARMVLIGVQRSEALYARTLVVDVDDKSALNAIARDAKEKGGGNERSAIGTAMHKLVERKALDPSYEVPSTYRADVDAILGAITAAGFEVVGDYSEVMVVIDRLKISGTADLILRHVATGRYFIADLKTGASVAYGQLSFSVQLAIYANADAIYVQGKNPDGSQDERKAPPDIDKVSGIILHCQPGSGHCDVYRADLAVGVEALALAYNVHLIRKERKLLTVVSEAFTIDDMLKLDAENHEPTPPAKPEKAAPKPRKKAAPKTAAPEPDRNAAAEAEAALIAADAMEAQREADAIAEPDPDAAIDPAVIGWLLDRCQAAADFEGGAARRTMAELWPEGVSKSGAVRKGEAMWDADDCQAVEAALDKIGKRHEIPWPPNDPRSVGKVAEKVAMVDTVVVADALMVKDLRAQLKALNADDQAKVREWSASAKRNGTPWSLGRSNEGV